MKTIALIDGDTILFEAAMSAECSINWDDQLWTTHSNQEEVRSKVVSMVDRIMEKTGAEDHWFALSCSREERFRPKIMPTYKSNRTDARKPVGYSMLRDWALDHFVGYIKPGLEGDDLLGIWATMATAGEPVNRIMVAIDKDLRTIPGTLYNYQKDTWETISEHDADMFFLLQTLMGDRTDGFAGCPGIGPKRGQKVLNEALDALKESKGIEPQDARAEDLWPAVVATYAAAGLNEEVALQNARMARILRADDYDFSKKEPILWTP